MTYGIKPQNALQIYRGESLTHFIIDDYFTNIYFKAAWTTENTEKNVEESILVKLPPYLEMMSN